MKIKSILILVLATLYISLSGAFAQKFVQNPVPEPDPGVSVEHLPGDVVSFRQCRPFYDLPRNKIKHRLNILLGYFLLMKSSLTHGITITGTKINFVHSEETMEYIDHILVDCSYAIELLGDSSNPLLGSASGKHVSADIHYHLHRVRKARLGFGQWIKYDTQNWYADFGVGIDHHNWLTDSLSSIELKP